MIINVEVTYRDDKIENYICVDHPQVADWVILYLPALARLIIPKDAIQQIKVALQ